MAYGAKGKGGTANLLTEGEGLPLALQVTGASVAQVKAGLAVVDQGKAGRPRQRPLSLAADRGYDSAELRRQLRRRGVQPWIPRRQWAGRKRRPGRPPAVRAVSGSRWKVERTHAWQDNRRRLAVRYERQTANYVAFPIIAIVMVCLSRLLG